MAKPLVKKRIQVVKLRLKGRSYSQIKKELNVSKSTLSYWLRQHPLSKKQLNKLVYKNERRIEKFRNTMRKKRESRLKQVYDNERRELLPLSNRELYLFGLALYWGEGLKASPSQVSFSNSDIQMIKLYLYWLTKVVGINKGKIKLRLHLYQDMDIKKETEYWSEETGILLSQFTKPYIKKTTLKSVAYKGFGHGTCDVRYGSVDLKEKIAMGIKTIIDRYS